MLTIKSNLNNFRDRQGEGYTPEDLELLCKALIKSDIINFPIKKEMSAGFTPALAWKIADRLKLNETGKYLVINDISLQIANVLVSLGVNPKNIYLAYGKWTKKAEPDTDPTLYLLMKQYIKANIVETFTVIKLEEIFTLGIKFDGIIANPPYGKVGANITKTIIDKVDFDQYINLLPANDYKRNTDKDLFNFQSDMEPIKDAFKDMGATVTTHLANIHKVKVNDMTFDEFEVSQYKSGYLKKYFKENISRPLGSLANYDHGANRLKEWTVENTFVFVDRVAANANPFVKNPNSKSADYLWNIKALEDASCYLTYDRATKAGKTENHFCGIIFKTEIERRNFTNFIYSDLGNAFIKKVLKAMQKDGWVQIMYWMPRPLNGSWTRAWTVEELLADYGYTTDEIAEVISDLTSSMSEGSPKGTEE